MRQVFLISAISALLFSCSKEEEEYPFDQSPYIEFEDLTYFDNVQGVDTLIISFIVWDREGDVGLDANEVEYPFHYYEVVVNEDNDLVTISNSIEPPYYIVPLNILFDGNTGKSVYVYYPEKKTFFSDSDKRLNYYSCDENFIIYEDINNEDNPLDTLYAFKNKYFYNLHLNLLDDNGAKLNFQEIFDTNNCNTGNFNARIFDISTVPLFERVKVGFIEVEKRDKFSWKVTYKIVSIALKMALPNQFQISFEIIDRELSESNIASSGLTTLDEITVE